MASFVYYVPGDGKLKDVDPEALGLGDVYGKEEFQGETSRMEHASCHRGPDEGVGLCFVPPSLALKEKQKTLCGYYPARQVWRNCGKFWLGYEKDNAPGPEDLQRGEMIAGYLVSLTGGEQWCVPLARCWPEGTRLPRCKYLDENGELQGEIMEKHRALWDLATKVWDKVYGALEDSESDEEGRTEVTVNFDKREEWDICVAVLAANYRIGRWEVSALRLLSDDTIPVVLDRLVDIPAYLKESLAKKKLESNPHDG